MAEIGRGTFAFMLAPSAIAAGWALAPMTQTSGATAVVTISDVVSTTVRQTSTINQVLSHAIFYDAAVFAKPTVVIAPLHSAARRNFAVVAAGALVCSALSIIASLVVTDVTQTFGHISLIVAGLAGYAATRGVSNRDD